MIEFKNVDMMDSGLDGGHNPKVSFIGLGQAGINIIDRMVLEHYEQDMLTVVDSDRQTLEASVVSDKVCLGRSVVRGLGCQGDFERGKAIVHDEAAKLAGLTADCDYAVLMVGLGGGTGSAVAIEVAANAGHNKAQVIVVCTMPSKYEGRHRWHQACAVLDELRKVSDCVLVLANDRVVDLPLANEDARRGFEAMNDFLFRTMQALHCILTGQGLSSLTFADLRSLFGKIRGTGVLENAWIGWGMVENGEDKISAIEQVLDSPLFADDAVWEQVDNVLVTLNGGHEMSLAEMQSLLRQLKDRMPKQLPVSVGAHFDGAGDDLAITVVLARTTDVPASEQQAVAVEAEAASAVQAEAVAVDYDDGAQDEDLTESASSQNADAGLELAMAVQAEEPVNPALLRNKPQDDNLFGKKTAAPAAAKKTRTRQSELVFEEGDRGRFENASKTIYNGVNLDQPTFMRRGLEIVNGGGNVMRVRKAEMPV